MKIVEADGFEFRFEDALDAFVFDETDSTKPTFHERRRHRRRVR